MPLPRILNPVTDPAGYIAAAGAVTAAAVMITNTIHHHGVIDSSVIIAAIGAVGALFTRQLVTPVADPKNASGIPLVPAPVGGTVPPAAVPKP